MLLILAKGPAMLLTPANMVGYAVDTREKGIRIVTETN